MLFISPQKLFLFAKHLNICLGFLVMYQNSLIRKMRLISNFMTPPPGQQTIVIHILPNILRSECNQTMKLGQLKLIEYKMRNIFPEKSFAKYEGEASPRPFSGKQKLSISQDLLSKVLFSLFLLNPKLGAIEIY